ncbi:MAG: SRPBCC family protein [Pseudomonadota bacterium]
MEIHVTRRIEAPVETVWKIIGEEYAQVGEWGSAVLASKPRAGTPKVAGAPVAGRICETSLGPFTEAIEAYDARRHTLTYSATGDKMPGFMKGLQNTWKLRSLGANATEATMTLSADIAFPMNILMGWMMKMQFKKASTETVDDLQYFAETGRVSERKRKIDESSKAVDARKAFLAA